MKIDWERVQYSKNPNESVVEQLLENVQDLQKEISRLQDRLTYESMILDAAKDHIEWIEKKLEVARQSLLYINHECEINVTPDNIIWELAKEALKKMDQP